MALFGIRRRGDSVDTRPVDEAAIRRLAPYTAASPAVLAQVVAASAVETAPARMVIAAQPDSVLYLHHGRVRLTAEGRKPVELGHGDPGAAFALPPGGGFRITAVTPSQLVRVPSRFSAVAPAAGGDRLPAEWREDAAGISQFQDFYHALKHGQCNLPTLPDLARRISLAIDDPATASEDIARVIQFDPSLAARVMGVVNSAAYNSGLPIENLSQAVSRLGREHIRNLAFSFLVKAIFRTDSALLRERMRALWAHSCEVAAIAAVLARHTPGLDPERAMLAGLVHDIGVVPVLDTARAHPALFEDPDNLERVIDALRGEIGAQTMRHWGFDPDFVDIAARAEDWLRPGYAIPDYLDVVLLAQLHAYIGTPRMARLPRIDQVPAYRKLAGGQLTPQGSMTLVAEAQREIAELRQLLLG